MRSSGKSIFAKVAVILIGLSVLGANASVANAVAKKTITCYKGKAAKKVTAIKPKCAVGWSIKKPAPKVTAKPTVKATVKPTSGTVVFTGTYKGKIAMLWSDSDVQATSVSASGTGSISGLDTLSGTGSSSPASQCSPINGYGVLTGGGNTLKVNFDSSAKGCGEDSAAPTTVNITGSAVIGGGTGKFAGATGTLKVTGSFAIKSTAAGTNENSVLTLTLSGNINTK